MTTDTATPVGKCRAVTSDNDPENEFLVDEQYEVFLDLCSDDVRMAAAMALDAMATKMNLILRKIEILDLKTDGPSVARSMRELAQTIRNEVNNEQAFEVCGMVDTLFTFRETFWKDYWKST